MKFKRGRARHQKGSVEPGSRPGTWIIHWHPYILDSVTNKERRGHRQETIGDGKMRKFEAEEELRRRIEAVNPATSKKAARRDDAITLTWFIENRWRPLYEGHWNEPSTIANTSCLKLITAAIGSASLKALDRVPLQIFLNDMARKDYSYWTIKKIRSLVKSIFAEAADQDFLPKDPSRKLTTPAARRADETVLQWEQYPVILAHAKAERDRMAIKTASACAVRPEELFAFRWRCLRQVSDRYVLDIQETIHRGKVRQYAKTQDAKDAVALPTPLAEELKRWRTRSKFQGDDDPIFPTVTGKFIRTDRFLIEVLHPIRDALGLTKLNFQILRRSFATHAYANRKGTLKDIQKHLRHSKPNMALENYIKSVPASVFEMVDAMYEGMMGDPKGPVQ